MIYHIQCPQILLLEAGDEEPVIADAPALQGLIIGSSIDYAYRSQPESFACAINKDRKCISPRGKVMGGSSTLNAMWYARGTKHDYDNWADLGNPGWSYNEVLPYFRKAEEVRIPKVSIVPIIFWKSSVQLTGNNCIIFL